MRLATAGPGLCRTVAWGSWDEGLGRNESRTFLDVAQMGDCAQERNAEKSLRDDGSDFERVKVLVFLLREDLLHGPAQSSKTGAAEHRRARFVGAVEEVPMSGFDATRERRAIRTGDDLPAGEESVTGDRQIRGESGGVSDKDDCVFVVVKHLGAPVLERIAAGEPGLDEPALAVG